MVARIAAFDSLQPDFQVTFWNPFEIQPVYYPNFEQDLAIGQSSIQSTILDENIPGNYLDIIMNDQELPSNLNNADADDACDLRYPTPSGFVCTITQDGDNHLGYIGSSFTPGSLRSNGAMDIEV